MLAVYFEVVMLHPKIIYRFLFCLMNKNVARCIDNFNTKVKLVLLILGMLNGSRVTYMRNVYADK